jgi:hypothetical protein
LQRLAHRMAGPDVVADWLSVDVERLFLPDLVQHYYTDDGHGDGRLTPEGVRKFWTSLGALWTPPLTDTSLERQSAVPTKEWLLAPLAMAGTSRRDVLAQVDHAFDHVDAQWHRPLRETVRDETADEILDKWRDSPVSQWRYRLLMVFLPSLSRAGVSAERQLGVRDGLLVAIALEMRRRRHGDYPAALSQLSPALLPKVPADRMTGQPLSYTLVGGKPLVYSVGTDRDDDDGRPPAKEPWLAAEWDLDPRLPAADGDWVLFPRPRGPAR